MGRPSLLPSRLARAKPLTRLPSSIKTGLRERNPAEVRLLQERGNTMTKMAYGNIPVVLLTLFTAALGMAAEVHFGPIQIAAFENARLTADCDGSVTPTPCEITFEFRHMGGRVLKQATMTIQPGTAGFLDLAAAQTGISGPVLLEPCWDVTRGSAFASLEVFDRSACAPAS